ncbi:MAG TPA: formylglycine-generating enzyme family protein [Anaerolineales bacterium]|nr:formylglycine-generating enzyme family protein [Anaerolineales bacterium]
MKKLKPGNLLRTVMLMLFILAASIVILNLDVVLRFVHSFQNGTLTEEKIRFDIASFNIGRKSPVIPVNKMTSAVDGMLQMYVPEGEFVMGMMHNHDFPDSPQHTVYLDAFWMDRVEVTNAMYLKCMQENGCTQPVSDNLNYANWIHRDHPIVYITWFQAEEYCHWAGRRLPTEAEWEKAARGTDGRRYPWGNDLPTPRLANYSDTMIGVSVSSFRYPLGASPYGVLNMSGNVREWVADWYDPDYYSYSPYANPKGPEIGMERSLRSTSYNEDGREIFLTSRLRHDPESAGLSRGFRCAEDAEAGK